MKIRAFHIWAGLMLIWSVYTSFLMTGTSSAREITLNTQAAKGKRLWQDNNCSSCHQVYGLGGYLGPDLTNVYSRGGAAYVKAIIRSGTAVMPAFDLNEEETSALAAYLCSLDSTGSADPANYKVQPDGMINP